MESAAFINALVRSCTTEEEKILVEVLSKHLNKDIITSEDIKLVTLVYKSGEGDTYRIFCSGQELGYVRKFWDGNNYKISYTPF